MTFIKSNSRVESVRQRLVTEQKQRVEHNRFRKRDRENSMHQNLSEGARIAANGGRHSQAGKADADSYAHRGEADVNASGHFC